MFRLIVFLFWLFGSSHALAQVADEERTLLFGYDSGIVQINRETSFFFDVSDGVSDGCWLTAPRVLSMAQREFLDAGYTNIAEEYGFGVTIRLGAIGYETVQSQCAVHVSFEVGISDVDRLPFDQSEWFLVSEKTSFQNGALLTGPKAGMSSRINEAFAGYIDEFIVYIQQEKNRLNNTVLERNFNDVAKAELLNSVSQ